MANRVAMAGYLDPARFKWVFFVDCFMFPFDNTALVRNPDLAAYMPLQTKLLQRYAQQLGTALAAALAEMIAAHEISEPHALPIARGYLHDNAAALYK